MALLVLILGCVVCVGSFLADVVIFVVSGGGGYVVLWVTFVGSFLFLPIWFCEYHVWCRRLEELEEWHRCLGQDWLVEVGFWRRFFVGFLGLVR